MKLRKAEYYRESRAEVILSYSKSKGRAILAILSILAVLIISSSYIIAKEDSPRNLETRVDQLLSQIFKPQEPGAAIIIAKDGKVIFRKGYGMANLELEVPVEPNMVFRLGSITKQFTAVAILMLMEQGKLSLNDPLTKFISDYPTHGQTITIEHLLTHTSGIKSYTEMPEWIKLWRKDIKLPELIDIFKEQPMEFEPGTRWKYNNSGYILLGAIIEKVSGLSYEEFLKKNIFIPLGMKHTAYGHVRPIIPRRVPGYSRGKHGIVNAAYLSMTQPYAAGALVSSVDDLLIWNEALLEGKLLKKKTLELAWTPYRLINGESTGYGYGWFISDYKGTRIIEHGGGINGFSAYALSVPQNHLYVALLANSDFAKLEPLAFKIAAIAMGKPYKEPVAVTLDKKELEAAAGVYVNEHGEEWYIRMEKNQLYSQRAGGIKTEILAASPVEFFVKDSFLRFTFSRNKKGEVIAMKVRRRIGPVQVFKKTTKPLPKERKAVSLDPEIYNRYVGEYEIAPGMTVVITREGDRLMISLAGQEKEELLPESETRFFPKKIDATIEFVRDETGKVTGLVIIQGRRKIPAEKIK